MGDCQAPLNRILIIQLQQEFFPPGLGPSQIPPSPPQHLPSPAACSPRPPPPAPTHCGGLWPISWGPREGLASAPSNQRENSTSSWGDPCCGQLLRGLHPGLCMGSPGFGAGQGGCAHPSTQDGLRARFSGAILPHARPVHMSLSCDACNNSGRQAGQIE